MQFSKALVRVLLGALIAIGACVVAGCGGTNTYTIGGIVSGLPDGGSVELVDNGTDFLTVSANGNFTFGMPVDYGGSYSVAVLQSPVGYTCVISGDTGAGTNVTSNITSVSVVCNPGSYTIGGTVSGLPSGASVTLTDNATDVLTETDDIATIIMEIARHKPVWRTCRTGLRKEKHIVARYRLIQGCAFFLPAGNEFSQGARIHDGA